MSTELVTVDRSQSVMAQYTNEQMKLLTDVLFVGATQQELIFFLTIANRMHLDPFQKQISANKYNTKNGPKVTIVVGIDGYRARSAETKQHIGTDAAVFEYDGPSKKVPSVARVTVWKKINGERCSFTGTARWDEFYPGDLRGTIWKKMPHNQLSKCAEAQALRMAFSALLADTIMPEENESAMTTEIKPIVNDEIVETKATAIQPPALPPSLPEPQALSIEKVYADSQNFGMTKAEWSVLIAKHGVTKDKATHTLSALSNIHSEILNYVPPGFSNEDAEPPTGDE